MSDSFLRPEIKAILTKLFEEDVAFQRLMGLRIISFNPERPRMRFDMQADLIGHPMRKVLMAA